MRNTHFTAKLHWYRFVLAILFIVFSNTTAPMAHATDSVPTEPLLHSSNVQYVGAFRVPNYYDGVGGFSYAKGQLAFNPANNSLFIVGSGTIMTEISIPSTIVNTSNLNAMATATVLQKPWTSILPNLPDPLVGATDGTDIGGLLVDNGQLIGTAYAYYSGANTQTTSHFVVNSLNLSSAKVLGLYSVGTGIIGARVVSGVMTAIPSEWQDVLGQPDITGGADVPIIDTTSSGPAAVGFNPATLGASSTPATPYLYYPVGTPLGAYTGPANPMQNGNTQIGGAAFVPGTSSVLFFGSTATNYSGYGEPADYGDNWNFGKGPHSLNGEISFQVWAYNASDFVAVKNGSEKPWNVMPYDVWNFLFPYGPRQPNIGGAAYDPTTGRVYVSLLNADKQVAYSSLPLIEVFQVNLSPSGVTNQPQIGTLAVTSSAPAPAGSTSPILPGPVPAGSAVTLTAGNVYAITGGTTIKQVAFYLDTNNDGVLETGSDQLLGSGTGTANLPTGGSSNWALTIPTTGMAPGSYIIFAQATDSNGLIGNPISATMVITGGATPITPASPVKAPTTASITPPMSIVAGTAVTFTGSGDNIPTTYAWTFGDGATSAVQNPSHTYATPSPAGGYPVTLKVSNSAGSASTTIAETVTASAPVVVAPAGASINVPSTFTVGTAFTPTAKVTAGTAPLTYSWLIDGTSTATGASPSITLTTAGVHTLTVIVSNTNKAKTTATASATITATAPNKPPVANFTDSVNGLTVGFTSTSSDPNSGGSITFYAWNFGDGNTSNGQNPSHTYAAAKTYIVTLMATDNNDLSNSVSHSVTVTAPVVAPSGVTASAVTTGQTANFTANAKAGTAPITYTWNFGDGSPGNGSTVSHTYAEPGTYIATVTATNGIKAATTPGSNTATVTVKATNPDVIVTIAPYVSKGFFTYTLPNGATGKIFLQGAPEWANIYVAANHAVWNFGDGTVGSGLSLTHAYKPGTYIATVTIFATNGEKYSGSGLLQIP